MVHRMKTRSARTRWLVVGALTLLIAACSSGDDVGGSGPDLDGDPAAGAAFSLPGRWVLESWGEGDRQVFVVPGETTTETPWIEFSQTFAGVRDGFISADGFGTAGTFRGNTGCNAVDGTEGAAYEYSAGHLVLSGANVTERGCDPDDAESVILAMLTAGPDGIEVLDDGDRMTWYGSNIDVRTHPLTWRRIGTPPAEPAGEGPAAPSIHVRTMSVDGVDLVTATTAEDLPHRAEVVRYQGTVIDSGDGPELCLGGVSTSLPPQCSGPIATGLEMGEWSEEANGVRWGERTVTVTWPPVDGVVELIEDTPIEILEYDLPMSDLPEECRDQTLGAGSGPINEYARSLGDHNGGLYVANSGDIVLQVVGDPEPHREALAEHGGACVIEVPRSESEQRRLHDQAVDALRELVDEVGEFGVSPGPAGKVTILVAVADIHTAETIAAMVEDPTAVRVVGTLTIVR